MRRTLRDALYGLAVGDALGVPGEFQDRDTYFIDSMVSGGVHRVPAGTFSDDTSMALATCDSIVRCEGVDIKDMRKRFCSWIYEGAYAVDGKVFDFGNATAEALAEGRGLDGESHNGNGSLMRIVALAFVEGITDKQVSAVSAITHAHEISRRACVIYVRVAQALLAGDSVAQAISHICEQPPYNRLAEIAQIPREKIKSTGYVVDTLEAALWALATTNNFRDCLVAAVNLGNDTDTVGAVAGGLAGIVYGKDQIPEEWMRDLRGKDIIESVCG